MTTACKEWNKQAKEVCSMLGPKVEFVPITEQLDENSLRDIHYTESASKEIGHLLAGKITHFLGAKKTHNTSPLQARRRHTGQDQTVRTLVEVMTTAFTQLSQPKRRRW